jgi:hypothetical protein
MMLTHAKYLQAYAALIPDYEPIDEEVWNVSAYLGGGISAACQAAGS